MNEKQRKILKNTYVMIFRFSLVKARRNQTQYVFFNKFIFQKLSIISNLIDEDLICGLHLSL